jgi:hypothetical protein
MRSLKPKKDNSKRNQIILGFILIFVMFASTFGILTNSFGEKTNSKKIDYNNFIFINQNGFWITKIRNINFFFKNNPKEIENIKSELKINLNDYYNKPLYIDSKHSEAASEIYNNLDKLVLRIQPACFEESCGEGIPIKNCKDNLIVIKENNISNIISNENCVFINGPKEDLTAITDEFLFKLLEIKL